MNTYWFRVLLNASDEDLKYGYGIPSSNITSNMRRICPLLQFRNMRHLRQIMKTVEVSISKIIEMLQMSVKRNKVVIPTYLSLYE